MKNILHSRRAAFLLLFALLAALLTGCADKPEEGRVVKLGVTGAVYEELWRPTIEALAAEGITLELVQFSDFALPNNALNSGDIQMNAFQHHAYFDNDKSTNGYDISVLCDTFVITMNLFSKHYDSPADIPEGGKVAVPNDATNYGRALLLLQDAGLLTLGDYTGTPTTADITSAKVSLVEVNAGMTYQYVDDEEIAAAVVNGNYAASYGVDPETELIDYDEMLRMAKELRPKMIISSASDNMNIVMAMNMGADDFIAKPFDLEVLMAKVQALLRRAYDFAGTGKVLECGGAVLDIPGGALVYGEGRAELTKNELRILQALMEKHGSVVSRDALMLRLWQTDSFVDENTLTVNVTRLRRKLEALGLGDFIKTRKGLGYIID